jgi:hypothetical protein
MSTRTVERKDSTVVHTSGWRNPRFQRLAGIATATGLLLSFVAISCLNADVQDVTQNKIPYIQERIASLSL